MTGQRHVPVLKPSDGPPGLPAGFMFAVLFAVSLAPLAGVLIAGTPGSAKIAGSTGLAIGVLTFFLRLWPSWPSSRRGQWLLFGGVGAFITVTGMSGYATTLLIDRDSQPTEQMAWVGAILLVEGLVLFVLHFLCKMLLRRVGVTTSRQGVD